MIHPRPLHLPHLLPLPSELNPAAPVDFEIPRPVITEAIVNAVAHRNYRNNGFFQVLVFADRIEVWNPGELPPGLTPELLRKPHGPTKIRGCLRIPAWEIERYEKELEKQMIES